MKVALVHDWMTNLGGGERVLAAFSEAFPSAPIYTSVYSHKELDLFDKNTIHTSFLQKWPLAQKKHQLYPLLRTLAFESFDFSDYDVVLSSSSAEAKGIITSTETTHISYIHTPTRYYWSGYEQYLQSPGLGVFSPFAKLLLPRVVKRMRRWDFAAAQRPDVLIANSTTVQQRIEKYYNRQSNVIAPPVDFERFKHTSASAQDYYLVVGRLIPYKRVDLAVRACSELNRELIVVGNGPELSSLQKVAGPSVRFIEHATDKEVTQYYLNSKAFIMTAFEDFGITPVEAMAAGKPVIAYGKGGVTDSVVDGKTGLFYKHQSVDSLKDAISDFEKQSFSPGDIKAHAQQFSKKNFIKTIEEFVTRTYEQTNQK